MIRPCWSWTSRQRGWIPGRIELREMIRRLAADGKTILVSSHILSELGEMCDVVGIIEQGQILAVGSVAEIQRRGQQQHQSLIRLRVLGGVDGAAAWLDARGDVHELKVDGDTTIFAARWRRKFRS